MLSIASKLLRLTRLERERRLLLVEAMLWLALMRIFAAIVPFRRYRARLGALVAPTDDRRSERGPQNRANRPVSASLIGWAVTCAARNAPFTTVCLPQALAAKMMLRRRGVVAELYFGFCKADDGELATHAWLRVGDVEVTGYPVARSCTPIACYK